MYFDLRRGLGSTLKLTLVGTVVLVLLNSARIGILVWTAYSGGPAAILGLHNWIGYALFLGFYLLVLVVHFRMGGPQPVGVSRGQSQGPV